MPIALTGGPYDGMEIRSEHLPRCPEIMAWTDEACDGFHVYATDGPSETVNEYPSANTLPPEVRKKIEASILAGESQPIDLWHELCYEGVVARNTVLNLYRDYRKEKPDGTSVPPCPQ